MKMLILQFFNKLGLIVKLYNPSNSEKVMLKYLLNKHQINTVLDIGANIGQFSKLLRKNGYKHQIISCEPLTEAYTKLEEVAKSDLKWETHKIAIGKEIVTSTINVSENSYSSSLLQIHDNHLEAEEASKFIGNQNIEIKKLNHVFIPQKNNKTLLKIDTQGFELEVIEGAIDVFNHIDVVLVELSIIPMYKEGPLYTSVISKLDKLGFELYQFYPEFTSSTSYRLLQANGFFVRKEKVN